MSDDKVYYPEEILDVPLPGQLPVDSASANAPSSGQQSYSPATSQDQGTPTPRIARETISSAINTKSRKILDIFEFTQMGALQIGKHELGVSGDMRFSPNGILARNLAGEQTFAIDGDTGDALFQGTITGRSLVAGNVFVGDGNIQIDGEAKRMLFYANDGKPAIVIGNILS